MTKHTFSILSSLAPLGLAACVGGAAPTTSVAQSIARDACPAFVPASLTPSADQTLDFVLDGVGVQQYACAHTATGYAWTFIAPDADLFLPHNDQVVIGHHFAGPTWQYEDGSEVVGKKVAAVTVDKTAIPWLLLVAVSHGGDDGRMTEVTSIQRLSTAGGLAPATGCDAAHLGDTANVPYTATYFFYRERDANETDNLRCGE